MRRVDRRVECGILDGLVEAVCAGQSRALVVCGEAGVGKTRQPLAGVARNHSIGARLWISAAGLTDVNGLAGP
jgi:hypothetical protein